MDCTATFPARLSPGLLTGSGASDSSAQGGTHQQPRLPPRPAPLLQASKPWEGHTDGFRGLWTHNVHFGSRCQRPSGLGYHPAAVFASGTATASVFAADTRGRARPELGPLLGRSNGGRYLPTLGSASSAPSRSGAGGSCSAWWPLGSEQPLQICAALLQRELAIREETSGAPGTKQRPGGRSGLNTCSAPHPHGSAPPLGNRDRHS